MVHLTNGKRHYVPDKEGPVDLTEETGPTGKMLLRLLLFKANIPNSICTIRKS
jgi:hypothetical protein